MDGDTTDSFLGTSSHVTVWIDAAPDAAAVTADLGTVRRLLEN
jgi:hypothetical protein